ncbi:hypothetical protein FQN54_001963 [Arachnomyces sp. PD_36]|nr:hypothetical protein FQN54_001963 [Arachnomyces sp. PD_36]
MMSSKRSRAAFEADLQSQQSPYALYGTPLPPLDPDVRDDGSYVPIWKQEVTDDRGRKRLHGAFTGGFSAGYFNTVGSKEGWTPSTFVSSRENRAKDSKQKFQQRPEDFMDEEDIREDEESKKLQTADDFAGFGSTQNDPNLRGGWMDILKIGGETMGIKLLKKMGWREGQGIGPKVRRKAAIDDEDNRQDSKNETHLFAPENPRMVSFIRKTDYKGLGFQGEERLNSATTSEATGQGNEGHDEEDNGVFGRKLLGDKPRQKKKGPARGGFGVGILNDTGSDDEDPYQMGPQISYNRTIGQDKKKKGKTKNADGPKSAVALNPLLGAKPVFISKKTKTAKSNAGYRKCHDGRLPLDGFVHGTGSALSLASQEKKYAPPEIPKGWKSAKTPSGTSDPSKYVSTADAAKASSLDPKSRAALLGEAQLPGKSIFDYMTPEARDRIAKATGRTDLPPALSEKGPKGFEPSESQKRRDVWSLVPKLDKDVAIQALSRGASGWMPYAEEEKKRARYRAFLEIRAGLRDTLPERAADMGTDDWVTELNEFARAAEVFKPISGMMASRFTSSASQPRVASDAPESSGGPLLREAPSKPEDPAETAAKMGMYGPMTRKTLSFYPSRLLCKRFNVRPPSHVQLDPGDFPDGSEDKGDAGSRFQSRGQKVENDSRLDLVSKDVMNQLMIESGGGMMQNPRSGEESAADKRPQRKEIVVDADRNEALETERPGADVFKAVFGSDDEDEDEEE